MLDLDISSIVTVALALFSFDPLKEFPPQAKLTNNTEFCYIIVGGGTAGCTVAARLAEANNCSVLVLEAGDNPGAIAMAPGLFFALPNTGADFDYRSTPDPYAARAHDNRTVLTSGFGLGGSSMLNHHLYIYDVPETFNTWADITGDNSWSYENVLEAMKEVQNMKDKKIAEEFPEYHGFDGKIGVSRLVSNDESVTTFLKAQAEVGNPIVDDLNSNTPIGFAQPQFTIASSNDNKENTVGGVRQTPAYSYLKDYKKYPNLSILKNIRVKKIIIENKTAIGVEAIYKGENYIFKAKKEVILSAGVFNTPQILQLSGIGPKEHLESKGIDIIADLPVGDSLRVPPAIILVTKTKKHFVPLNVGGLVPALNPTILPFSIVQGSLSFNESSNVPTLQIYNLFLPHDTPFAALACATVYQYKTKVCLDWQRQIIGRDAIMSVVVNLEATSTGTVRLDTTDIFDAPLITTGFYSNEEDLTNFKKNIKLAIKFLESSYYKDMGAKVVGVDFEECAHLEFDTDEFWECYIFERTISPFLYWGTCSMGNVVDGDLKVIGIDGLRVVDASVFPTPMRGATNAAVLATANIAVQKIKAANE